MPGLFLCTQFPATWFGYTPRAISIRLISSTRLVDNLIRCGILDPSAGRKPFGPMLFASMFTLESRLKFSHVASVVLMSLYDSENVTAGHGKYICTYSVSPLLVHLRMIRCEPSHVDIYVSMSNSNSQFFIVIDRCR